MNPAATAFLILSVVYPPPPTIASAAIAWAKREHESLIMIFDKKISFDGVAVIVATIGLVVWLSNMKSTLDNHTTELMEHKQQIEKANETLGMIQQNLAVLTVLQAQKQKP